MYKKRTEPFDAPCFVLTVEKLLSISSEGYNLELVNNKDFIKKIGLQFDEENLPNKKDIKNAAMYNSLVTRKVFEKLKEQNQYKKLNVVIENPSLDYEIMLDLVKDFFERAEDVPRQERKNKKNEEIQFVTGYQPYILDFIKGTEEYKEMYIRGKFVTQPGEIPENRYNDAVEVMTSVNLIKKGLDMNSMLSKLRLAFTRYEIDFEKETMTVYKGNSKVKGANPRDFRPYEYEMEEKLEEIITFNECKKLMLKTLFQEVHKEKVDIYNDNSEQKDDTETENVKNQSYKVGYNLTKLLAEKYLLYVLNFVFENNLIEKQVEKVRVLKNKNTKKKKGGGSNYKSIVKERYIYKEEEAKRIAEYVFDELEKINKERKESEYTKEEWEVKSHIRTLKDGRKIMVSGQKRKRRLQLKNKKEEVTNKKEFPTLGMTERDLEKMINEEKRKQKEI